MTSFFLGIAKVAFSRVCLNCLLLVFSRCAFSDCCCVGYVVMVRVAVMVVTARKIITYSRIIY